MEELRHTETVAVRQGPAATLEVLYRAEYTGMVRLAFTLIGSNAEAEEVVQDSFVEISRRFDELEQPGAYLRTVVVSRCRPPDLPPEAESLWDVLERLPEHQRIAVVLRYYCGYRASEISKIIDTPAATVRSHLRRALGAMRKELSS